MRNGWGKGRCDLCGDSLSGWDYRYHGTRYCRRCTDIHFGILECSKCGRMRRIPKTASPPVCKYCQIEGVPCIRCGKKVYRNGLVTADGPVCASCARHFRPFEKCPSCGQERRDVFRREAAGGRRMCEACHRKLLPTCAGCGRKRSAHTVTEDGKSLCRACATLAPRRCEKCGKTIPAGRGRICAGCAARNGLERKTAFGNGALEGRTEEVFGLFSSWFEERRGPEVASLRLLEYLPFFLEISHLEEELGTFPDYAAMAERLGTKRLWENRRALEFMDSEGIVAKDPEVQAVTSERDMILRKLDAFPAGSLHGRLLRGYHALLEERLREGRTSLRSVRLAMTPATAFLRYCRYAGKEVPSREAAEGYLWLYPGQKAALTGFANYLDATAGTGLNIRSIQKTPLERPRESREMLKQHLISALRDPDRLAAMGVERFARTAIGYLHRIDVPKYVRLGFVLSSSRSGRPVVMHGEDFVFPVEILRAIGKR